MKTRLYKLFLIQLVYAVSLGSSCRLGVLGIAIGLMGGTAASALVLLVRRDNIESVVYVAIGAIVGGFLGVGCLDDIILRLAYGYDHGFGEGTRSAMTGGVIGAIVGGWLLSRAHSLDKKIKANAEGDTRRRNSEGQNGTNDEVRMTQRAAAHTISSFGFGHSFAI